MPINILLLLSFLFLRMHNEVSACGRVISRRFTIPLSHIYIKSLNTKKTATTKDDYDDDDDDFFFSAVFSCLCSFFFFFCFFFSLFFFFVFSFFPLLHLIFLVLRLMPCIATIALGCRIRTIREKYIEDFDRIFRYSLSFLTIYS